LIPASWTRSTASLSVVCRTDRFFGCLPGYVRWPPAGLWGILSISEHLFRASCSDPAWFGGGHLSEFAPATAPSFFWSQGLGKTAGRGELHNTVIRTRLPSLLGKAPETGFRPLITPKSAGPRLLPVKTGHILNSLRRKPAVFLLHVTHIHGLARIQRPKRQGCPHIAAERETADAVPWVPRPHKLTDYRAGDLLGLGNDSYRRKRLCTGLW